MNTTILMIGSFDTKGAEYAFLRKQIKARGCDVLAMNTGVFDADVEFPVEFSAAAVAEAAGHDLMQLRNAADRGNAMKAMTAGAAALTAEAFRQGRFAGVIGMGGSGGSSVVTAAMRALPIGVPKVCLSTVAGGNTAPYVGLKDVTLIPSITDISGLNRISRLLLSRAAGAICGMVETPVAEAKDAKRVIAASMFGNTTECVDRCRKTLEDDGFEVLVFHATGTGGRTMESLIDDGVIDACLDITTTEWADTICQGIFDAGDDRLSAPGRQGIPHLIVPGCVDMVNFGPIDTVPQIYRDQQRQLYEWNPSVTLMRTNIDENRRIGEVFARKANEAKGPVAFLLPLRGLSVLDGDGGPFCDRKADAALFEAIKANVDSHVPVHELDANINDPSFADEATALMKQLIDRRTSHLHPNQTEIS